MRAWLWSVPLVVVLCLPPTQAHAAPDPPEWMTRILHDYQDDWGSDSAQTSPADGHDLIALDLREEFNATMDQNALVLRLTMNRGWDGDTSKPELRDTIAFKAKGQSVTREFKTQDNAKFSGDFDGLAGPFPVTKSDGSKDGQRFYVEGVLKWSTLGLKAGDKVTEFFVQGYAGSQKSDHMVGGYTLNGQKIDTKPPGDDVSYRRNEYPLRGPVMYVRSDIDQATLSVPADGNRTVTWTLTNTLGKTQMFILTSKAPTGVDIGLHSGAFGKGKLTLSVAAGVTATVHAYVLPKTGAASGDVDLTVTTNLGGRNLHKVSLTVPGSTVTEENSPSPAAPPPEKSPGVAVPATLAVLFVAAWLGTRRGR